jgi:signal transduction histidine kinase
MNLQQARLLIVDDEEALMTALCNTLRTEGYAVTGLTSSREALAQLRERQFDLLLTDLMMPEVDGMALLQAAQDIDPDIAGVVMTGNATVDTAVQALRGGATDLILKPFRLTNLLAVVQRALETRRLRTENIQLREAVSLHELSRAITNGLTQGEILQRTVAAAAQQSGVGWVCILLPSGEVGASWGHASSWNIDEPGSVELPIVIGNNSYGTLRFSSTTTQRHLSPGQLKALNILVSTAATAFEAASLLSQLRQLNAELEQRVRDRTQELQDANADLESFSYSVSHDLRAPLRRIDGFCQMFIDEFAASVSPDGLRMLENVRAGTTNMAQLIEALLRFARYSRQPLQTRPVKTEELVRRIAATQTEQLQGREVEILIRPLPDTDADGALLEHVFTNLISNAIKFTATRKPARIEIGSRDEGDERMYFVKDNGVGFDMKYASRLFGVFQRLHSQVEFEGTGIGLSIVHRIVRRHGGRVWAESRPQEGATFYLSLPIEARAAIA